MTTFTDRLYQAGRPIWEAQLNHSFVQGIASGSLDPAAFENWVRQEYLYLKEYSRVFAWGAAKSRELDAMRTYSELLYLILDLEIGLHREYATRFGVSYDELESEEMWPTTQAYTDFLVRRAAEGDLPDLVSALLPCFWGYSYLAQSMARDGLPSDSRYAEWIQMYVSPDFTAGRNWLIDEMNRLVKGVPDSGRDRLVATFVTSSRYEWRFWEMCWRGETWETSVQVPDPASADLRPRRRTAHG